MRFEGFSVLHCHGVFPSGDQQQQQKPLQQQVEKIANFIFIAAARGNSSQNHHFLWVSEVTLGIFGVQFWGFSVLHCHGVFPSGNQQQQQQKPLQQQEEKVAKIHSSSKRKKQPKSSFSMGFRSYVRHFRGAILGLLRPSLPWCFPIRDWQQQQQKPMQQQEVKVAKIHSSSKRKKQPKSSFSMGFRSYVRHFWGAILGLLRPSLPWCFPIWGPAAAAKASAAAVAKIHSSSKRKKQPKSSFSMGFRSYVRHFRGAILGLLRPSLPWCFPIRDQQQQQKPLQQQEEKVAKIHSSSKRKKQPKSSFSIGFRSYVGHFRGAILGLLRPSLPWCFPIRGPAAAAKASAAAGGKGSQNSYS